jgi:ATP-dependent Lhr-like helicase
MHDQEEGPLCFRLAGRAWEVVLIDWAKGVLKVRPATRGRVPSWIGMPSLLSTKLCQSMMGVLLHPSEEGAWLSGAAAGALDALRNGYLGLLDEGSAPIDDGDDGVRWHTFAGGAVNRLLGAGLESLTGRRWVAGNISIHCKEAALTEATAAARALPALEWDRVASVAAHAMARGLVSKFQPCLPQDAEDRLLAERLLDLPGALRFLATTSVNGSRPATRPSGLSLAEHGAQGTGLQIELGPRLPAPGRDIPQPVVWVDTPEALRTAADELRTADLVGLDVETALDSATLCLLKLATAERTFLIDPFAVASLEPLRDVLTRPSPMKVIHGARRAIRVFASMGIELGGVFDTMEASRRARGRDAVGGHSLSAVCARDLGFTFDDGAHRSSWSRRPLSEEQLSYAALEAEVLIALHAQLRTRGEWASGPR